MMKTEEIERVQRYLERMPMERALFVVACVRAHDPHMGEEWTNILALMIAEREAPRRKGTLERLADR